MGTGMDEKMKRSMAQRKSALVVEILQGKTTVAQAMTDLLRGDAFSNRCGVNARACYENLFSGPALGKAYAGLFRELV